LEPAVVSTLDEPFRPSLKHLFHLSPVVAVIDDVLTYLEVFFEGEVVFVDIGPEVVEVPLPDLFGSEF
jgi:hypothetical protein